MHFCKRKLPSLSRQTNKSVMTPRPARERPSERGGTPLQSNSSVKWDYMYVSSTHRQVNSKGRVSRIIWGFREVQFSWCKTLRCQVGNDVLLSPRSSPTEVGCKMQMRRPAARRYECAFAPEHSQFPLWMEDREKAIRCRTRVILRCCSV